MAKIVHHDQDMETLIENQMISIPSVGDVLEGIVIEKTSNSILLDLGPLGTGIVFGTELKDGMGITNKLKPGDTIKATLIEIENEDGYFELSIRQASYERAWEDITSKQENKDVVHAKVLDANKGGLILEINGITGFLPVSQLSSKNYPRVENGDKNRILELLKKLVGQELIVRVIDHDRTSEKLIVSEKAAQSEQELTAISELKVKDIIEGEVSGVVDFGAFVKFLPPSKSSSDKMEDRLEGLVHISELAWQLIDDPREVIKTGDKVQAKIIGIDETRISLSLKALKKDPWTEVHDRYNVGDVVDGKVDKINPFGAFVYLDKDIHGLAHVSEFKEVYPGKSMEDIIHSGETYKWRILSIEPKDHRMGLAIVKKK
jgi:small subunit ribosomal protein S1